MKHTILGKIMVIALALVLAAGCLVACGGGEEASSKPTTGKNPTGTTTTAPATGTAPVQGTDPTQGTQPKPTETQPAVTQPTEPQPTEPQPTEPQPTEPGFICRPGNVVVHVYVPQSWDVPNIWAWNNTTMENLYTSWPGEAMVAYEGHFVMDIPVWVDSLVINGQGGTVQTSDLAIDSGKEVWIVITDRSCDIYYRQPTEEELNPDLSQIPENITVRVYAPQDWNGANLWAWNNGTMQNLFDSWPGQPMQASGDHYELVIPSWVDSLVVNGQNGAVQTADISIQMGKDVWVVIHDGTFTLFYSQPTDAQLDQLGY